MGKVTDNAVHIPSHIADLGKLGSFHLYKGSIYQLRQTAGNFGLAYTGAANHEDVLGDDVLLHGLLQMSSPPAVADGYSHRLFRLCLPYDIFVQLGNDLPGSKLCHVYSPKVSTLILWFVKTQISAAISNDSRAISAGVISVWAVRALAAASA